MAGTHGLVQIILMIGSSQANSSMSSSGTTDGATSGLGFYSQFDTSSSQYSESNTYTNTWGTESGSSTDSSNWTPAVVGVEAPTTFNAGSGADPMINMTPQEQATYLETEDKGLFESIYDSVRSLWDDGVSTAVSVASVAKNLINLNPAGLLMNGIGYIVSEFENMNIELGKPFTGGPTQYADGSDHQMANVETPEAGTSFNTGVSYVPPSKRGRQEAVVDLSRQVEFEFKAGENIYEMLGGRFAQALNIGRPNEVVQQEETTSTSSVPSSVGTINITEVGEEYDRSLNVNVPWQRGGGGVGYDLSNLSLNDDQENLLAYNFAQVGIDIPTSGFLTQAIQGIDKEWSDPTGGGAGLAPAFGDGLEDMTQIIREVNSTFEEMGGEIDWATGRITKGFTGTATIMSRTLDTFIEAVGATSDSLGIYASLSTWDDLTSAGENADIFKKRREAENLLVENMLDTAESLAIQVENQRNATLSNVFGDGKIGGITPNDELREEFDKLGRGGFQADMESRARELAQKLGEVGEDGLNMLQRRAKAEKKQ